MLIFPSMSKTVCPTLPKTVFTLFNFSTARKVNKVGFQGGQNATKVEDVK